MICSFLVHLIYSSVVYNQFVVSYVSCSVFEYDGCFHYIWIMVWHGGLVGCRFRISHFYRFAVSYKNIIDLIAIWVLSKRFCLRIGYIFVRSRWCPCSLMCWLMFEDSVRRLCRLHSSISFSPFSFISLFAYFPMILLSNGSLLRIFVFALKWPPMMIKTFLLMLLMMSDNCS